MSKRRQRNTDLERHYAIERNILREFNMEYDNDDPDPQKWVITNHCAALVEAIYHERDAVTDTRAAMLRNLKRLKRIVGRHSDGESFIAPPGSLAALERMELEASQPVSSLADGVL